jgi:hypothetical protein
MAAVPDGRIAAAGISGGRFFQADSHLRRPRSRRGRRRRHPRRRSGRGSPESGPRERLDLLEILAPLPGGLRAELVALWDEYESATSAEARLAKALDKLETIMQHNQGLNPENFDYRFNLGYGWQRRLRRGEDPGSPRGAGRELARMPRLRGNTQRGLAVVGGTTTSTPGEAHSGTRAVRMVQNGLPQRLSQRVPVSPGVYTVSGWLRTQSLTNPDAVLMANLRDGAVLQSDIFARLRGNSPYAFDGPSKSDGGEQWNRKVA